MWNIFFEFLVCGDKVSWVLWLVLIKVCENGGAVAVEVELRRRIGSE